MMRAYNESNRDVSLLSRGKTICNSEKVTLQKYICLTLDMKAVQNAAVL